MRILIDGDWIIYAAGFAGQKSVYVYFSDDGLAYGPHPNVTAVKEAVGDEYKPECVYSRIEVDPLDHVLHSAKNMLMKTLDTIQDKLPEAELFPEIYVDGDGNFRSRLATIKPYKGQRRPDAKPQLFNEIRNYLITRWDARVVFDQETDDVLAIEATEAPESTVIVSVDKDLLQVPGRHYNPNKGFRVVTKTEGLERLYVQAAQGDPVDNIGGCYKIGAKKAREAFVGMSKHGEPAMWNKLINLYAESVERYPNQELYAGLTPAQAALENMRLVYLRRRPGELWLPPTERK